MYKTIAIDGACRHNGSPNCISAGACFIMDSAADIDQGYSMSTHEDESTSQRGELYGLLLAVEHVAQNPVDTIIITDSEYLFNTMTKRWVDRWIHENWLTAKGTKVKNQDLWRQIWSYYILHEDIISFYHIKGHLLSVGDKKCHEIMQHDASGHELYKWAYMHREISDNKRQHAIALSVENNGFDPDEALLQHFAAMNLVADTIANLCVEKVESKRWQSILSTDVPTL